MTTLSGNVSSYVPIRTLARGWGWLLVLGAVQILAGSLAIAAPPVAALAAVIVVGVALLASGVFHLIHAFKVKTWPNRALYMLGGVLYAAGGLLALFFPLQGAMTLTILVGAVLISEGVLRSMLANAVKPRAGWGWLMAAGIASIVLGMLLFAGWPGTAIWAIGLLLGVNLIFSGATNCALALGLRRSRPQSAVLR